MCRGFYLISVFSEFLKLIKNNFFFPCPPPPPPHTPICQYFTQFLWQYLKHFKIMYGFGLYAKLLV